MKNWTELDIQENGENAPRTAALNTPVGCIVRYDWQNEDSSVVACCMVEVRDVWVDSEGAFVSHPPPPDIEALLAIEAADCGNSVPGAIERRVESYLEERGVVVTVHGAMWAPPTVAH